MKRTFLAFLILFNSVSAQVIRSKSSQITIIDGTMIKKNYWTITPGARPDIYETVSSSKAHKVTFVTDIDSISFEVKLGKKYNFVILYGKDSAYTQISGVKNITGAIEYIPPKPFTVSQVKQITKACVPFNGVYAVKASEKPVHSDLVAFGKTIGNAQIIALGESTHGTSEFFSMKHRALEYAVLNLNVRVFAIEDNQLAAEQINNYVLNGVGKLRDLCGNLFGVWIREEVFTMIEWIKEYNTLHPDKKVEFVGIDLQNPMMAFDSLNVFLSKKDPQFHKQIQELLFDYNKNFPNYFSLADTEKISWNVSARKAFDLVVAQKYNWLKECRTRPDSMKVEWAIQNARIIKQCSRHIITPQTQLYRDSAMAENVQWTLSMRAPGIRMVLWAHDFHISRGDDKVKVNNYYNGVSMGSWLSKWYGTKYKAFGLETYSGEFTAMPTYTTFDLSSCALATSPQGTLDEALHQSALKKQSSFLYLDLGQIKNNAENFKWLCVPTYVRFANHVCQGNSYNLKHSIPFQFDGIFFIDKTTGSKLVK